MKLKTALLGCGRVAEHYKKILIDYSPINEIEIVAVCDKDLEKAIKFSKYFNCEAFSNFENLVEKIDLDIIFILTPSGDHFKHSSYALMNGINVLCEKPLTLDPDEALILEKISNEKGLWCTTVFQNRWNPAVTITKKAIEMGRLKKIITANVRLQWCRLQEYYQDEWHGTWLMDGGVINQQAIHHIDALQWILGPIESVCAISTNRINELEAEDTLVAILKFSNGALGTIEATTAARPKDFEAAMSILGEGGKIQIGGIALNKIDEWYFVDKFSSDQTVIENYSMEVPNGYGLSHSLLLKDLVQNLKNGIKPEVNIKSAVNTLKIIHSLYASVEQKKWIFIKDNIKSEKLGK
jgi:predicted dehydrogenase